VLPKYDSSHPFEFICQEKIDGVWEDISQIENAEYKVTYDPGFCGNVVD